jgi:hypothetical protein
MRTAADPGQWSAAGSAAFKTTAYPSCRPGSYSNNAQNLFHQKYLNDFNCRILHFLKLTLYFQRYCIWFGNEGSFVFLYTLNKEKTTNMTVR